MDAPERLLLLPSDRCFVLLCYYHANLHDFHPHIDIIFFDTLILSSIKTLVESDKKKMHKHDKIRKSYDYYIEQEVSSH